MLVLLAACGKFQDPNIVVDLRVVAMTASVPEQVIDVGSDVLPQLVASEVCALVADPSFDGRRLRYTMTLCPASGGDRCDSGAPHHVIAQSLIADPDITVPEPRLCATVEPDGNLLGVVKYALDNDILHGIEGEAYEVELQVGGQDADPTLDLFATKSLQVIANIPAGRAPNHNPTLTEIDVTMPDMSVVPLPLGRCVDQTAPLELPPATKVRLLPIEPDGARETYDVVKLDGTIATFTESLTYEWIAGDGKFSTGDSGGKRDPFGNEPPLFSDWTSPAAKDLDGPTGISIWIVQRDERLGATWYESCIRVVP